MLINNREPGSGFLVQTSITDGQIRFFIDGSSVDSTVVYDEINAWVFFGLTYDGTSASNNALFYKGLVGSSVSLEHTGSVNEGAIDDETHALDVAVGTFSGGIVYRPMKGLMDNVRIFDSVLSLADLEEIRLADINNEDLSTGAAPEPSTLALAVLGLVSLGFVAWRRSKRA